MAHGLSSDDEYLNHRPHADINKGTMPLGVTHAWDLETMDNLNQNESVEELVSLHNRTVLIQANRILDLENMLKTAHAALKSYEYGNGSAELAKAIAKNITMLLG